jgi:DNA-binding Xre family transcriptional regulator
MALYLSSQLSKQALRGIPVSNKEARFFFHITSPTLLSYFNSKGLNFSRRNGYHFTKKEVMPMTVGDAVRERILELCQERNISVNKLSGMSGITQSTLNNIVSGRNNSATVSTIKKICDGLDISIEEFFQSELFRGLEQEIR